MSRDILRMIMEAAARLAPRGFFPGSSGNISARKGNRIFITSHGVSLASLKEKDIIEVDEWGRYSNGVRPSSELPLHLAIYRRYRKITAVLHSHPPFLLGLAAAGRLPLPVTLEEAYTLGTMPLLEQETMDTESLIPEIVKELEVSKLVLLRNHGLVVAGEDMEEAVEFSELAENSAISTVAMLACGVEKKNRLHIERVELPPDFEPFSDEHIRKISRTVAADEELKKLTGRYFFNADVILEMIEAEKPLVFHFKPGVLAGISREIPAGFSENRVSEEYEDGKAFLHLKGKRENWKRIFSGEIHPVVAASQGFLKLAGNQKKIIRWSAVLERFFGILVSSARSGGTALQEMR